jgi:hypothetical protein
LLYSSDCASPFAKHLPNDVSKTSSNSEVLHGPFIIVEAFL